MYKIYKITNKKYPSEIYIGSTKLTLKRRFQSHASFKHSSVYPYIKRDGRENFEISVIDYASTKEEALEKEIFWTIFFKKQGYFLYNRKAGDEPFKETKRKMSEAHKGRYTGKENPMYGKHLSEEAKAKISKANKGRHHTEEVKKKMSETRKGENHPLYGKHYSKETKYKLRKKNGKAIRCTNDGKCFISTTEAAEYYNIGISGIRKSCRGKLKSTHGHHFEYI